MTGNIQTGYNQNLNNHLYACEDGSLTCKTVHRIYFVEDNRGASIILKEGTKIEDAIDTWFNNNIESSRTKEIVDEWYYKNIEQTGYSNYIEDTIWCNDRSDFEERLMLGTNITNRNVSRFFTTDASNLNTLLDFKCKRESDSFTVSTDNGNGNLTYPVGLLTIEEVILAGFTPEYSESQNYLVNGTSWSLMTPIGLNSSRVFLASITNNTIGIRGSYLRPAISLKPNLIVKKGTGTSDNPYIIN